MQFLEDGLAFDAQRHLNTGVVLAFVFLGLLSCVSEISYSLLSGFARGDDGGLSRTRELYGFVGRFGEDITFRN